MRGFRNLSLASLGLLALAGGTAGAVHLDVELKGSGDGLAVGFCMTQGVGCDLPGALGKLGLPAGTLPTDTASGDPIFAADFADFPKPYDTANPGFNATGGALQQGELIRYRALGALAWWDPAAKAWTSPPAEVRIRLFGGLDPKTVVTPDYSECGGLLVCIPKEKRETVYEEGSTVFSGAGIAGAESLLIDNANSQGALHTHLDWFLETASGAKGGPAGAYLVRMQLVSDRRAAPSAPFLIAFNNGLSDEAFADAIAARMGVAPGPGAGPDPDPDPASGQEFLAFKYRETAAEKLAGCRPRCQTLARGTVSVEARLDWAKAVPADAGAAALELNLGAASFRSPLGEGFAGQTRSGRIKLPVLNGANENIGKLRWTWKNGQAVIRYTLAVPVFARDFLEDDLGRGERLESITLRVRDAEGQAVAVAGAVVEIGGSVKSRRVVRGKTSYDLGTARLSSGQQTR